MKIWYSKWGYTSNTLHFYLIHWSHNLFAMRLLIFKWLKYVYKCIMTLPTLLTLDKNYISSDQVIWLYDVLDFYLDHPVCECVSCLTRWVVECGWVVYLLCHITSILLHICGICKNVEIRLIISSLSPWGYI